MNTTNKKESNSLDKRFTIKHKGENLTYDDLLNRNMLGLFQCIAIDEDMKIGSDSEDKAMRAQEINSISSCMDPLKKESILREYSHEMDKILLQFIHTIRI